MTVRGTARRSTPPATIITRFGAGWEALLARAPAPVQPAAAASCRHSCCRCVAKGLRAALTARSMGGTTEERRSDKGTLQFMTLEDIIAKNGHSAVDLLKVGGWLGCTAAPGCCCAAAPRRGARGRTVRPLPIRHCTAPVLAFPTHTHRAPAPHPPLHGACSCVPHTMALCACPCLLSGGHRGIRV